MGEAELNALLQGAVIEDVVHRGFTVLEIHLLDKRFLEIRAISVSGQTELEIWVDGRNV